MYTDRQLITATQIAYYDFHPYLWKNFKSQGTLRQFLLREPGIYEKLQQNFIKTQSGTNSLKEYRAVNALRLYHKIIRSSSPYSQWILRCRKDDNAKSGLYACLIETSKDEAIIAFRGSESNNKSQIEKDWLHADLGLLNSVLTAQQLEASLFMADIEKKYPYKRYAVTGHSLGGNLCTHAVITAPEQMRRRIVQNISFDGPGFSSEYIRHWWKNIFSLPHPLVRYQWSLVGNLLFHIPGEQYKTIETNDLVYGKTDLNSLTQKHDTGFVLFDQKDLVIPGKMDFFAKKMGRGTRVLDICPSFIGDQLVGTIQRTYEAGIT